MGKPGFINILFPHSPLLGQGAGNCPKQWVVETGRQGGRGPLQTYGSHTHPRWTGWPRAAEDLRLPHSPHPAPGQCDGTDLLPWILHLGPCLPGAHSTGCVTDISSAS